MLKFKIQFGTKARSVRLLYVFLALIVLNGISGVEYVSEVAKYAKLVAVFFGIIMLSNQNKLIRFSRENKLLIFFWILCLIFCLLQAITVPTEIEFFINNITFIFYIYFFYLIVDGIIPKTTDSKEKLIVDFCKIFAKIINIIFLIFTPLGLLLKVPVWHQLEDRIGLGLFYGNYIQLGIFGLCGAIVQLIILKIEGKSVKALFWLILYLLIIVLSNSRNAQLILLVSILFLFFVQLRLFVIRYRLLILAIMLVICYYVIDIYTFLTNDKIQQITTGRSSIWNYVLKYLEARSFFMGKGIFGANTEILLSNKSDNYYFNRIDFLYFHNSYLEIFAAAGIIGFLFFMWRVLSSFRNSGKSVINPVLIGILMGAFFESFLIQPVILVTILFWMLFFLNEKLKKGHDFIENPEFTHSTINKKRNI